MLVYVDKVIELKPNAMLVKRPELILEWDFEKNMELGLDVYAMTYGVGIGWWKGTCGHGWKSAVRDRAVFNKGCHYCSNNKVLRGFNDIHTTNPDLGKLLLNHEDGYKYTEGSKTKVDWKCGQCNKKFPKRMIFQVKNEGLNCSICSNKIKYPERFMKFLLEYLNLEFYHDVVTKWSNNKRYDFYLPEYNLIIETHGEQHYEEGFKNIKGSRTLKEEQANDKYKYEIATSNNIDKFIVIDCRYSRFKFIKDNVVNSELSNLFNLSNVNWEELENKMKNTLLQNIASDWVKYKNSKDVAVNNKSTIVQTINNLMKATELGYCKYEKKEDLYYENTKFYQLDEDYQVVEEYVQDDENFDNIKFNIDRVKNACREMIKHKGFYWSKKNGYEKNKIKFYKMKREYVKENCILQIDMNNGDIIKEWDDVHEIIKEYDNYLVAPLNNVLYGNTNSYKGFVWVRKRDYSKSKMNKKIKEIQGNPLAKTKNKPILKIDIVTGEILDTYYGISNAAKSIGVADTTISKCLSKQRLSTGGFIWIRKEDYNTIEGKGYVEYVIKRKVELGDNDGMYGRTSHNTKRDS